MLLFMFGDKLRLEGPCECYWYVNLYPNPTKNDFTIEVESLSALTESIQIVVYDKLGRIIETGSISIGGNGKVQFSLNKYVTGTYFVKCFSNSLEKHFKVVKL